MIRILLMSVFSMPVLSLMAQNAFKLAPPYLEYESAYYKKERPVAIVFAKDSVQIRYTTNGQIPTEQDLLYTRPVILKGRSNVLKARVFGAGFTPSEVTEASFFRAGMPIENIVATPAHKLYSGSGPKTLIDGLGGWDAFNRKTWVGYNSDTVTLELSLAKSKKAKQLVLHVLENQAAWIYPPQKVEVYAAANGTENWELIAREQLTVAEQKGKSQCRAIALKFKKPLKTSRIMVKAYPMVKIPDGYPGSGYHAWLFIDEVNLY